MYDKLIKRLWECVSGECWNCSQHKDSYDGQRTCADNLMKQAADAIEELSKPRWIPVTERLPDEDTSCLVFLVGGEFSQLSWMSMAIFYSGVFRYDDHSGEYDQITHWMPLPEPPKEE